MDALNTTVNKFVIAAIGMAVILANTFFHQNWMPDQATVNSIAAVLTPALVYFIPNKKVQ